MPTITKPKLDSTIRFRAEKSLWAGLSKLAKKRRCSVSHLVREIAYSAVEKQEAA